MNRKSQMFLTGSLMAVMMICICIVRSDIVLASDIRAYSTDISIEEASNSDKKGLSNLKKKINKELKGKKGKWSVYVKNLDTNEYMLINDRKMPSASLIKLYVMMTVYNEINEGNLKESSINRKRIKDMITISDNEATNSIVESLTKQGTFKAGIKKIKKYCKMEGYSKTRFLVEMGKSSPKNVTCARDCGLALEKMYAGRCVNKSSSKKMIKLFKAQTRRGKIPAGVPKGVTVANKTGETSFCENDAAIVYSEGADYVIVVMSHNGQNAVNEINKISSITYKYFN